MNHVRWSPTLPSFGGRLCPRVLIPATLPDFASKLEAYYLHREGSSSIFVRRVDVGWLRKRGHVRLIAQGPFLADLPGTVLYEYLMATLGSLTMSAHFQRSLSKLCLAGKMGAIKRWFQTTDGVVLPLLLSVEDPDQHYADIDRLTKFSLENCANNYSHFIGRLKKVRRLLRKDYAEMGTSSRSLTDMATYRGLYLKHAPKNRDPYRDVQYLMCWSQTRATGLADDRMIRKSLDKAEVTLSTPRRPRRVVPKEDWVLQSTKLPLNEPVVDRALLDSVCHRIYKRCDGRTGHLSAGPNACIESPRNRGGQTGAIARLTRMKVLHSTYDFKTLEVVRHEARRVGSVQDLLSWCIQESLEHPAYVRCVKLHAVAEPSKARTITVCTLPYLLIVGALAKLLQPSIASDITRGGLESSRNFWNFLYQDLDPTADVWHRLRDEKAEDGDGRTYALSSDLEEATDYGDIGVARQILDGILRSASGIPGFPVGLGVLAKTLFLGKRYCFRHTEDGRVRYFVKRSGWLMGDRLTKVILTLAHELAIRASGLHIARICGDDVTAFSKSRSRLARYLVVIREYGFKVSEDDSYISSRLAFYCEEAAIPPMRFLDLPSVCTRRKTVPCYVDYPRIRLLIPTSSEVKAYSYTDVGRFAQLGKEMRWILQGEIHPARDVYVRASMLQHLLVPQPADTMCPFTPVEVGGDGSFPHSEEFFLEILARKARNPVEIVFRLYQLHRGVWGYRLVRHQYLDNVIHKHHMLVPKIEELRSQIREHVPDALIEGDELMLNSISVNGLETPERTFFRMWRAWYWSEIFRGRDPPEITLDISRECNLPRSEVPFDARSFYRVWRGKGFTFQNRVDYLVITKMVQPLDYMNLGWYFGVRDLPDENPDADQGRFLLNEENTSSFIEYIRTGRPMDQVVRDSLHRMVESDSFLKWEFSRKDLNEIPQLILLVSTDVNLGIDFQRLAHTRRPDFEDEPLVFLIKPTDYLYGFMSHYESWAADLTPRWEVIVDFGCVVYNQFTLDSPEFEWFDDPDVVYRPVRNDPSLRVYFLSLKEGDGGSERCSLTTQPASQWRRGFFPSQYVREGLMGN
nr:RNA-dependent RNA polymerase [Qingdao RNA virus 2]